MRSFHLSSANKPNQNKTSRKAKAAHGFSLIEVLVSIVVLSFGLLGMVGMQAASMQANRDARLQSAAAVLARELAEMIRGNKNIGILPTATNPYIGSFSTPLAPATPSFCLNVASTTAACANPTEIARAEITEWLARVDNELPGARVDICFDQAPFDANGLPRWACTAGAGDVIVVKIGWTRGSTDRSRRGSQALERATVPSIVFPVTAGNAA
jgi:type IV pilus assembly protein PilV